MSSNTTAKVYESRKTGQHGWRVSAQESTYPVAASVDVTAYVYCSKHAPKTKTAAHSVPAKPEDFTISDARCGSGNVQAGGFAMSTPNFDGGLIASQRLGKRGWRTRIDSDIGVTATTLAYCAEKPAPRGIKGSIPSTGREFISGVTPACPAGHRPLAGGFAQPDAITGFAGNDYRNFVPYESTRSWRDWENAGYHGGDTESHLIPLAYCR
jgi:hypothetical protein